LGRDFYTLCMFEHQLDISELNHLKAFLNGKDSLCIERITPYIPTQDPMLDRSEILKQLGITEQEDELFQQQYKNV